VKADRACNCENGKLKVRGLRRLFELDDRQVFPAFEIRDMKFKLHVFVFFDIEHGIWRGRAKENQRRRISLDISKSLK
jgi:ribosomal protein S26